MKTSSCDWFVVQAECPHFHAEGKKPFTKGAYCLGKIVWGKGWEELIALLSQHADVRSQVLDIPLDCYGTGEAASEVSM